MTELKNNTTATVVSVKAVKEARKELFMEEARYGEECPLFLHDEDNPEVMECPFFINTYYDEVKEDEPLHERKVLENSFQRWQKLQKAF